MFAISFFRAERQTKQVLSVLLNDPSVKDPLEMSSRQVRPFLLLQLPPSQRQNPLVAPPTPFIPLALGRPCLLFVPFPAVFGSRYPVRTRIADPSNDNFSLSVLFFGGPPLPLDLVELLYHVVFGPKRPVFFILPPPQPLPSWAVSSMTVIFDLFPREAFR